MKLAAGVSIAAIICSLGAGLAQTNAPDPTKVCSLQGLTRADLSLVPNQIPEGQAPPPVFKCGPVAATFSAEIGGARIVAQAGRLHDEHGHEEKADVVTLFRARDAGAEEIAKFVMPHAAGAPPAYDFKLVKLGDIDGVQIGGNATRAVAFVEGKPVIIDTQAWTGDVDKLAASGHRHGRVLTVDLATMQATVSAFPVSANDPKMPGSAAHGGSVAVAQLRYENAKLVAHSVSIRARTPADGEPLGDDIAEEMKMMREARAKLPAGVEPCFAAGWSKDSDPAGLNVRAAPDARSQALGKLPAPWKAPSEGAPAGGFRTEFKIVGYRAGWFLIEKAQAPGAPYVDKLPRNAAKPYAGRGWVAASMVEAAFANGGLADGGLRQAPHPDARLTVVRSKEGNLLGPDTAAKRLIACSGYWGLFEAQNGVIGWWRGLCSNQVTNCS